MFQGGNRERTEYTLLLERDGRHITNEFTTPNQLGPRHV